MKPVDEATARKLMRAYERAFRALLVQYGLEPAPTEDTCPWTST